MEGFWVPHPKLAFVPATFQAVDGSVAKFRDAQGEVLSVPLQVYNAGMDRVIEQQLLGIEDVCHLSEVCKAALLSTIRVRFSRQEIYTRVARILIAVNPFQTLSIYSSKHIDQYKEASSALELPPHIYGIGVDVVAGLRRSSQSQAVLISGESGAGKTESAKLVLSCVSESLKGGSHGATLQDKILQTSPILESFGNAMTVRNNNSSRFGKWLQMAIDRNSMTITSCSVIDYLLELTRVHSPGKDERNYHIFFQLSRNRDLPELKALGLEAPSSYAYLKCCKEVAPGVDDTRFLSELQAAFTALDFSAATVMEIFGVVASILHVGNLVFEADGEGCRIKDDAPMCKAAKLLGVDTQALRDIVTFRQILIVKEVTKKPLNAEEAKFARDSLARLLYGRLFKLLIDMLNKVLSSNIDSKSWFGLLDIAGFESFETNSLEQLFINLSNEKLQQHFNSFVFRMELEDYKAEGLANIAISYNDNTDILALIDGKGGILPMLDEEGQLPKSTASTYINKVCKAHEAHPRFVNPRFAANMQFGISHFAGIVNYTVTGFMEKNVDKPLEVDAIFKSSSVKLVQSLVASEDGNAGSSTRGAPPKKKSMSAGFRNELSKLVAKLEEAEPHFVRCIKPNKEKLPDTFDPVMVMEQLTYSGVFEVVLIRQQGFASRMLFADYIHQCRILLSKADRGKIFDTLGQSDKKAIVRAITEVLPATLKTWGSVHTKDVAIGNSKVFLRLEVVKTLERARDMAIGCYAVALQKHFRGHRVRQHLQELKKAYAELLAWRARNTFYGQKGREHNAIYKLKTAEAIAAEAAVGRSIVERMEKMPVQPREVALTRKVVHRMETEADLLRQLVSLTHSIEPLVIDNLLGRIEELEIGNDERLVALASRSQRLKEQLPLVKAMQLANLADMSSVFPIMEAIKSKGLDVRPDGWIVEVGGEAMAKKLCAALEELKSKDAAAFAAVAAASAAEAKVEAERQSRAHVTLPVGKMPSDAAVTRQPTDAVVRRKTITGVSGDAQNGFLVRLKSAAEVFDVLCLEILLAEALQQGFDPADLKESENLLRNLQKEMFLSDQLRQAMQAFKKTGTFDAERAVILTNLIKQATRLGIAEEECLAAKDVLRTALTTRARNTVSGRAFDGLDREVLELFKGAFDDLGTYKELKDPTEWRNQQSWADSFMSYFSNSKGPEEMLAHQTKEIRSSLTHLPSNLEHRALQAFRDIMTFMYDKPISECHRLGFAQNIVYAGRADERLGNEIYLQVMKQLTGNPSRRSESMGWRLLLQLAQQVTPGRELEDFLRAFLLNSLAQNKANDFQEAVVIASQCIADLNTLQRPDAIQDPSEITVVVLLIDNSSRKVKIHQKATIGMLAQKTAEQIGIQQVQDFALFQSTDDIETHRLLPDTTEVNLILQKWAKLKEASGRGSRFLLKRRFLMVNESLHAGDILHATLTYRQALWDYLHNPISEVSTFCAEVAGTLIWTERDTWKDVVTRGKLEDPGVLEQLVPAQALREVPRTAWQGKILEVAHRVVNEAPAHESAVMRMSRVVTLLQRMKLFGAYYWLGSQILKIPPEKVSLPEAPPLQCTLNMKEPTGQYYVCVDYFGVRYLSSEGQDGKIFQRGFSFNEEALERVLRWGAKQDVLQLVVQTINPQAPAQGRLAMTVNFHCPAAVDAAYAIHRIWQLRKTR